MLDPFFGVHWAEIDGMLPSLAPLLVECPGKREPLCEVAGRPGNGEKKWVEGKISPGNIVKHCENIVKHHETL